MHPADSPCMNYQQTASRGANKICSLLSFNEVAIPNVTLWMVCDFCALAAAPTEVCLHRGLRSKSSPLAPFENH